MATLLVVMALFFLVSMVAAYTSRNLVFEQRTSANYYRSSQAFEVAEAGIEWAIAQLNAGRVDGQCMPSADATATSFRRLMLTAVDAQTGAVTRSNVKPGCLRTNDAGWSCNCPAAGNAALADPGGTGIRPAFRVAIEQSVPWTFVIQSTACTSSAESCLSAATTEGLEAAARVRAMVSIAPALVQPPRAAVTIRGNLVAAAGAPRVVNTDAGSGGITVRAGSIAGLDTTNLAGPAGTPGGETVQEDSGLRGMSGERWFASVFGVSSPKLPAPRGDVYRQLPNVIPFACGGGCATRLRQTVERNPGRPILVTDRLVLESAEAIGSVDAPALLVVMDDFNPVAGAIVTGVVHVQAATWTGGAGRVLGAVMAEGDFNGTLPDVQYDATVVDRVRGTMGPIVRVPGGWRDF